MTPDAGNRRARLWAEKHALVLGAAVAGLLLLTAVSFTFIYLRRSDQNLLHLLEVVGVLASASATYLTIQEMRAQRAEERRPILGAATKVRSSQKGGTTRGLQLRNVGPGAMLDLRADVSQLDGDGDAFWFVGRLDFGPLVSGEDRLVVLDEMGWIADVRYRVTASCFGMNGERYIQSWDVLSVKGAPQIQPPLQRPEGDWETRSSRLYDALKRRRGVGTPSDWEVAFTRNRHRVFAVAEWRGAPHAPSPKNKRYEERVRTSMKADDFVAGFLARLAHIPLHFD